MSPADEPRGLYLRLLRAWNDRDADAMAACFAEQGIMIGFDGSLADGRTEIRKHLSPIFADHPTAAFVTIVRSVRNAGTTRIVRADVGMLPPGATDLNPAATARQTVVAEQAPHGEWLIALFQNTPAALHGSDAYREALLAELTDAFRDRGPLPE